MLEEYNLESHLPGKRHLGDKDFRWFLCVHRTAVIGTFRPESFLETIIERSKRRVLLIYFNSFSDEI